MSEKHALDISLISPATAELGQSNNGAQKIAELRHTQRNLVLGGLVTSAGCQLLVLLIIVAEFHRAADLNGQPSVWEKIVPLACELVCVATICHVYVIVVPARWPNHVQDHRYLSAFVQCGFGLLCSHIFVRDRWRRAILNVLFGCLGFHFGYLGEMLIGQAFTALGLFSAD